MRFGSACVLALMGAATAAVSCSSSNERPKFSQDNSSEDGRGGSTGSSTSSTGKGSGTGGNADLGPIITGNTATGNTAVPDDDPTNNNITHPTCDLGKCSDFPADPLKGDGVPANAAELFGDADNFQAGSLCVHEPHLSNDSAPGAMMPANWVRPRFRFSAPSGYDLFEIRIHSEAETNDLVAYTKQTSWYLPKEIWAGKEKTDVAAGSGFANNAAGKPVSVTVRAVKSSSGGTPIGMKGDFEIAPVVATGSMVFWTVNSSEVSLDSSKLLGFAVGDEGVAESLTLKQVGWKGQIGEDGAVLRGYYDEAATKPNIPDGQVRCIGCHASTPDGDAVVFTDDWPWAKAAADVTGGGKIPSYFGQGAIDVMKMPWWGTQSMSKKHWKNGDRLIITSYGTTFKEGESRTDAWAKLPCYASDSNCNEDDKIKYHRLAWIDVESTAKIGASSVTDTPNYSTDTNDTKSLGYRQQQAKAAMGKAYGWITSGDKSASEVTPTINHAGDKIAYVSSDFTPNGHPNWTATKADIKVVEFNGKSGSAAGKALAGASDAKRLEYYPSYSPDDQFIAFTSAPAPGGSSPDGPYYNRFGEIHVIPADGGTSTKLAANEPVSCAGDDTSKGIINSWPKWAPDVIQAHGKTYYFVIFSSGRKYGDEFSEQFEIPENKANTDFKGLRMSSQLYLAAVVVDDSGGIKSYPAVYVWNQNRLADSSGKGKSIKFSNLTPDWAAFQLPPLVIESVPVDIK